VRTGSAPHSGARKGRARGIGADARRHGGCGAGHGRHAEEDVSTVRALSRARGVRAAVRLGGHVWASYGPN
jgi:hypothetical protein